MDHPSLVMKCGIEMSWAGVQQLEMSWVWAVDYLCLIACVLWVQVMDCLYLMACVFTDMGGGLPMSDCSCLHGYGSWTPYV